MHAIADGLFELHDDGRIALIGGYSPTSDRHHFPRLDTCPYTGATDIETVTLSTGATLWLWTAVRAALVEAGSPTFDAAFCGTAYGGVASGHKVLGALALTGMPIVDVEAGCASGGAALQLAAGAIRAGQYECVLVFGVEKMPKGIIRSSFFAPWREEAGLAATPASFQLRAQPLPRESGLPKEHLA